MGTGLECQFVEREPGQWFYLLEDRAKPPARSWLHTADAYGPFETEDEAFRHLMDNHNNPGAFSTVLHEGYVEAETYARLFAEAPENTERLRRPRW